MNHSSKKSVFFLTGSFSTVGSSPFMRSNSGKRNKAFLLLLHILDIFKCVVLRLKMFDSNGTNGLLSVIVIMYYVPYTHTYIMYICRYAGRMSGQRSNVFSIKCV